VIHEPADGSQGGVKIGDVGTRLVG